MAPPAPSREAPPLGVPLTGLAAQAVTKGYHLCALPAAADRGRVPAGGGPATACAG
jgi:hypothetical protein